MPTTEPTFGWTVPEDADALADGAAAIRTLAGDIAQDLTPTEVTVTSGFLNNFGAVSDGCRYRYNRFVVELSFRINKSSGHSKNSTAQVIKLPAALAPAGNRASLFAQANGAGSTLAVRMSAYVQGTADGDPGQVDLVIMNDSGAWDSTVWIRVGGMWLRDAATPLP